MRKTRNKNGFTLAEMMIVILIILILAALSFVAIHQHSRSLEKLRNDSNAKELFVVAQNHLAMAKTQNYLGRTDFGTPDGTEDDVYYFVVPSTPDPLTDPDSVLGLMLPLGSIDETVRRGSYIIRYQKSAGRVLDVFYWSGDEDDRYAHLFASGDYADFLSKRDDADALKTYGSDKSVIGYYGGVAAATLSTGEEIEAPTIRIVNAERLYAVVTDPNGTAVTGESGYKLRLIVKGANGAVKTFELNAVSPGARVTGIETTSAGKAYTVVLDDVTADGFHFCELSADSGSFVPGEDLTLQATASNADVLTNVAESSVRTTNSLFGEGTDPAAGTAKIVNFRHLENLAADVSGVNAVLAPVAFARAEQTTDLDWDAFKTALKDADLSVYRADGTKSAAGTYLPVTPGCALAYDGTSHAVSNVTVQTAAGEAGLFGTLTNAAVANMKLVDFTVSGGNAGTLAGTVSGTTVTNVMAVESSTGTEAAVRGTGSAGGLVGNATNAGFTGCGAALVTESSGGAAGGLIGAASGGTDVIGCYSGGRTTNGAYTGYSVRATGSAGGLIGAAGDTRIQKSYSTCSVYGATAGGLVGTAGGSASKCYATGLVGGTGSVGAFAGTHSGTAEDCRYYEIINAGSDGSGGRTYLAATGAGAMDGVTPLDADADAYNTFLGSESAWKTASPYDSRLKLYYSGKYPFPTVERLGASVSAGAFVRIHYGDWPAPEAFAVNTPQ